MPWTVACQPPLSREFSRQEYWSGLLCPPPRDLPDPGIKPSYPASPASAGRFFTTEPPGKPLQCVLYCKGKVNITCQVTDILVIHEKKKESVLQFVTLPLQKSSPNACGRADRTLGGPMIKPLSGPGLEECDPMSC